MANEKFIPIKLTLTTDAKQFQSALGQLSPSVATFQKSAKSNFDKVERDGITSAKKTETAWRNFSINAGKAFLDRIAPDASRAFKNIREEANRTGQSVLKALSQSVGGGSGLLGTIAGGAIGGAPGFIASAVTSVLGTVAGGLGSVVKEGLDFNRTIESARISLKNFLGTNELAVAEIEKLKKAAIDAPVAFTTLLNAERSLASEKFSVKDLAKDLTNFSIALGAKGGVEGLDERLERIVLQLVQMSTKGRAANEELTILAENQLPVYEILANAFGKTKEEIFKLSETGQLKGRETAQIIIKEFAKMGEKLAPEIKNTQAVLESNLSDLGQQVAGKATQNLVEKFYKPVLQSLTGENAQRIANSLAGQVDAFTGVLGDKAANIVNAIASGDYLASGKKIVQGVVSGITSTANEAIDALKGVGSAMESGWKSFWGIQSPSKKMQDDAKWIPLGAALGITDPNALATLDKAVGQMMILIEKGTVEGIIRTRRRIAEALRQVPEIQAMLATIGKSEGAGYSTKVGGGVSESATTGQKDRRIINLGRGLKSSADGRYQFLNRTWDDVAAKLGLTGFSAEDQDLAAIQLMLQRGMVTPLLAGEIGVALAKGNREWASLPGSPYGQHTNSATKLTSFYNRALGNTPLPPALQVSPQAPRISNAEAWALYHPGEPWPGAKPQPKPAAKNIVQDNSFLNSYTDAELADLRIAREGLQGITGQTSALVKDSTQVAANMEKLPTATAMLNTNIDTTKNTVKEIATNTSNAADAAKNFADAWRNPLTDKLTQVKQELDLIGKFPGEKAELAQLEAIYDIRKADEDAYLSMIKNRIKLSDTTIYHSTQANAIVLDHLARQTKSVTEIGAEFKINLIDEGFGLLDRAIDRATGKFKALNSLVKDLTHLFLSSLLQKFLFGNAGGQSIGFAGGGASGGGFSLGGLLGGGGNSGGGGGLLGSIFGGGQQQSGGILGGLLGGPGGTTGFNGPVAGYGGNGGLLGGLLGKIPGLGGLFGRSAATVPLGSNAAIEGLGGGFSGGIHEAGHAIGATGVSSVSALSSLASGGLLLGGGLLGKFAGGDSKVGQLLGFGGGTLLAGAAGASGIFGGGIAAALPALFSNPITAIIGGGLLAGALLFNLFGNKDLKDYRKLIRGEYAVDVKDNSILKQIREIGKQVYGGQYKKHEIETIRLEQSKELISAYAQQTGQKGNGKLVLESVALDPNNPNNQIIAPLQRREFGGPVLAGVPYLVGERRPEVFIPDRSGQIVPSVQQFQNGGNTAALHAQVAMLAAAVAALTARIGSIPQSDIITANPDAVAQAHLEAVSRDNSYGTRLLSAAGVVL